ncbi:type VII secretion-associated serine protease mycosin [Clavibacter sp. B3I6]|uniref:S8 family peptidase n=1 Tax=Clavibacter sp. B3I6 TaxID=3042268 RepID=UPI00278646E6|nr:S8 family serine peptidase [Clavibacter sp. B3I6]MDQ0745502.1 type VII secretion-associated serine protease mycosin [Clavibacter sp. B3I6]
MTRGRPVDATAPRHRIARAAVVGILALAVVLPAAAPAHADPVRERQYWLADYGVEQAWQTTRGEGVKVAVIDTGVDASVADLRGAVVGGTDVSGIGSADGTRPVGASSEHGTMVASLLAGRGTGTGSGVVGVAPGASLLAVSVALGGPTPGARDEDAQIADAVRWAVDNGASVINMSLTRNSLDWPESWDRAFLYAYEHDVVVVAAAGNRGSGTTEVGAPATIPGVLAVAGVDRSGAASFDASSQGITIAVAAPSEQLVGVEPGGGYVQWSGTSGAAPLVSGVVALVRAAHPELSADDVVERVLATARQKGQPEIYGRGLVDAAAAVSATVAPASGKPLGDLAEWVRLYRRAPVVTPTPTATATPDASPAVPADAPTADPATDALPTAGTLRQVGIPALVLSVFAALAAAMGVVAFRHFRRLLR